MRNAKITFILIAVFAWAALPAAAQLGVHVGGATSAVGQVGGAGQNVGAGLGSTVDTTVGANVDGLHRTTDGVTDTTKKTAYNTKKKTKQKADKTKDTTDKTAAKAEDKADKTVDQAKSSDAGAGVQGSSSSSVNAGGNSANVNSSTSTDANASGNGASVSGSSNTGAAANTAIPETKSETKSDSSDVKQTAKNSKGHGTK